MIALTLIQILQVLLNVVWWIIMVQFVLSLLIVFNVINTSNNFVSSLHHGLDRLTEPMYRPLRRILPNISGIDLAPLVVLIVIRILDSIILPNIAMSVMANGAI
ncbi:YggT family protein [Sphingomonas sp. A2-49]|uniref:YggT family protein n=1 Tax=Sphingomonas sp. A2-49 TaxID=1391375 RepID=UPI0021D068EA|nr:YggT family protein [Sphingomonas sp. A2-49]MCU6454657.1 YggT family protein [Sphingomonas sp. A2-49]